jgi:prepilin-type N-terminal cleavage/methylation domain-containing protein
VCEEQCPGGGGSRRAGALPDAGFTLIEVVIATSILGALAVSLAMFFLGGVRSASQLQKRQVAISVAAQALELVRSVPVQADSLGCVPLLAGRSQAAVTAQWAAAPAEVDLSGTDAAWTPSSCSSAIAVPFAGLTTAVTDDGSTPALSRDGTGYVVRTYVGTCSLPLSGGSCARAASVSSASAPLYRVVVDVSWAGPACATTSCHYVITTLRDPSADPVFNVRGALAPVAVADAYCTPAGTAILLSLLGNDGGSLQSDPVTVVTAPGHGSLGSGISSGIATYTPAAGWTGVDSFSYQLTGVSGAQSSVAAVTITVGGAC